jgi:hypothetical protein
MTRMTRIQPETMIRVIRVIVTGAWSRLSGASEPATPAHDRAGPGPGDTT